MDKEIASLKQAAVSIFHIFHKMQYFINKSVLLFAAGYMAGQDLQNTK